MPVILFAVFIDLLGFGMIVPLLPFITMQYGGGAEIGTGLISIYALMSFAAGPLWGRFSDHFGRKPALALTFFGGTLSYIVLANAESILWLFIARGLSGAMAGNVGVVMAALSDITTPETRGRAMGLYGAAIALGFSFGPGIGGVLGTIGGETSIFIPAMVAACLSATAMILTYIYVPETKENHEDTVTADDGTNMGAGVTATPLPKWHTVLQGPGRKSLLLMFAVVSVAQGLTFAILPFWADMILAWDERKVGFLLMGIGFVIAIVQGGLTGPMHAKFGELRSIMIGLVLALIGSLLIILGPRVALVTMIAIPLMVTGLTLTFPALNTYLSHKTDKKLQGTALGLSNGMASMGRVFGPIAGGFMFATYSPAAPFALVTVCALVVTVWAIMERRQYL